MVWEVSFFMHLGSPTTKETALLKWLLLSVMLNKSSEKDTYIQRNLYPVPLHRLSIHLKPEKKTAL